LNRANLFETAELEPKAPIRQFPQWLNNIRLTFPFQPSISAFLIFVQFFSRITKPIGNCKFCFWELGIPQAGSMVM
jgi:hypothetical protein